MAFGTVFLLNGIFFLYLILAVVAVVFIGSGFVVTIAFALGSKRRAAQGKKLGLKKAIPVGLFAIGLVPAVIVVGTYVYLSLGAEANRVRDEANDKAFACMDSHDVEGLLRVLDASPDMDIDDYASRESMMFGESLLHRAVRNDDYMMVETLIDRGARPNENLLLFACDYTDTHSRYSDNFLKQGHDAYNPKIVNALLDAGVELGQSQAKPPLNYFVTAMCGNGIDDDDMGIIRKMLRQGARLDVPDGNGKRAVDVFSETLQEPWAQKAAGQEDRVAEVLALLAP